MGAHRQEYKTVGNNQKQNKKSKMKTKSKQKMTESLLLKLGDKPATKKNLKAFQEAFERFKRGE
jgi:hypothetical protein